MRWIRLTNKNFNQLSWIGGALKSSWLAWRVSSHGDSTRSGWGISQQSRGDHQGWAERWSLPWIHKSLNFVIRMDGHITYLLCLGASHSSVLNHYIRTNMHSCILIVLWVSAEINCKCRVSRELSKGIILEGYSSARRSLSRVCVLTHSSTCSAWDFARMKKQNHVTRAEMNFSKIEVVNWILGPLSVAASRGDPLQPPAAGDFMVRESANPCDLSHLTPTGPGPSPSSCNHQKSAPDPLRTVTHSLCHPAMSMRCDDCMNECRVTDSFLHWIQERQFQVTTFQGHVLLHLQSPSHPQGLSLV